jgi:hypothetical protein
MRLVSSKNTSLSCLPSGIDLPLGAKFKNSVIADLTEWAALNHLGAGHFNEVRIMFAEPDFKNEKELEKAIASAIQIGLDTDGIRSVVLQGFGLDLAVFTEKASTPRVCLFEIKAPADYHGRCGFGNGCGEGNQIRLLFDEATQAPRSQSQIGVFDSVRWVLGNCSQPIGARRFLFFTCKQAQDAASNGVKPGKQNNLRLSAFEGLWITWHELIDRIRTFTHSAG